MTNLFLLRQLQIILHALLLSQQFSSSDEKCVRNTKLHIIYKHKQMGNIDVFLKKVIFDHSIYINFPFGAEKKQYFYDKK